MHTLTWGCLKTLILSINLSLFFSLFFLEKTRTLLQLRWNVVPDCVKLLCIVFMCNVPTLNGPWMLLESYDFLHLVTLGSGLRHKPWRVVVSCRRWHPKLLCSGLTWIHKPKLRIKTPLGSSRPYFTVQQNVTELETTQNARVTSNVHYSVLTMIALSY